MPGILDGKTALVTGGSRGLGRVVAKRLAAAGAFVVFNYATNVDLAAGVVAEIEADGGRAVAVQAPLDTTESIDALVAALDTELVGHTGGPGLDILVNNIGGGSEGRIGETSAEQFDETFSTNVRVPFLLTQALLPRLRDGGRIVNVSSATVRVGREESSAYVMAKAALDTFSRLAAKSKVIGGRGITVNSVAMGRTVGQTNAHFFADPANSTQILDATALGRLGTEDDVAGVVCALIWPDGGWITGQVIDATGGYKI